MISYDLLYKDNPTPVGSVTVVIKRYATSTLYGLMALDEPSSREEDRKSVV